VDLRRFAESVLAATTLESKLRSPSAGTQPDPFAALSRTAANGSGSVAALCRPPGLAIAEGGRVRVPPATAWKDVAQRVRILHALANHELQAAELFAWAIVTFPDPPDALRRGWLRFLTAEPGSCGMCAGRP